MTMKQRLQRPSSLVLQGFIAGSLMFFATHKVDAAVLQPPLEQVR